MTPIANIRFQPWQTVVLVLPIAGVIIFLLVAASWQINAWHLNWIWALVGLVFLGWRWLLVRWTAPEIRETIAESVATIPLGEGVKDDNIAEIEQQLNQILAGIPPGFPRLAGLAPILAKVPAGGDVSGPNLLPRS